MGVETGIRNTLQVFQKAEENIDMIEEKNSNRLRLWKLKNTVSELKNT